MEIKIIQFAKFQGRCLVLFEAILTGVEEPFLFHELNIFWNSIKNWKNEIFEKEHWWKLENTFRYLPVIGVNLAFGSNVFNYMTTPM